LNEFWESGLLESCLPTLDIKTASKYSKNNLCTQYFPLEIPSGGCSGNQKWNPGNCQCECSGNTTCAAGQTWDSQTCQCGCAKTETCAGEQKWCPSQCKCVCPVTTKCASPKIWDQTSCSCQCPKNMQPPTGGCSAGRTWDSSTCTEKCATVPNCESPMVFDSKTCSCKCGNKPNKIPEGKSWDENQCSVVCSLPPIPHCQYDGQVYNQTSCQCNCPEEMKCDRGYIFSPKSGCKCVPICTKDDPGCGEGKIFCHEICTCECKEGEDFSEGKSLFIFC